MLGEPYLLFVHIKDGNLFPNECITQNPSVSLSQGFCDCHYAYRDLFHYVILRLKSDIKTIRKLEFQSGKPI